MAEDLKEQLRAQLRANGGVIAAYPTGPRLERFNTLELAQALEAEIARSEIVGHKSIRLDMGLADAAQLAKALRRRGAG